MLIIAAGSRLLVGEEAQNLVEYTLMIGLVVLAIWLGVNAAGVNSVLSTIWSAVGSALNTASS